MRVREWSAFMGALAVMALTACKGETAPGGATAGESAAAAPPPAAAPAAQAGTPPPGATPEMVAEGQQTFATVCSVCHGPDGKGIQGLGANLTDSEWLDNDGTYPAIINTVKNGVPQPKVSATPMPPMGGANLTEDQVKNVAAYVWSLGGGK